jgi:hypothetical protein
MSNIVIMVIVGNFQEMEMCILAVIVMIGAWLSCVPTNLP